MIWIDRQAQQMNCQLSSEATLDLKWRIVPDRDWQVYGKIKSFSAAVACSDWEREIYGVPCRYRQQGAQSGVQHLHGCIDTTGEEVRASSIAAPMVSPRPPHCSSALLILLLAPSLSCSFSAPLFVPSRLMSDTASPSIFVDLQQVSRLLPFALHVGDEDMLCNPPITSRPNSNPLDRMREERLWSRMKPS